jgi:hypothetical protein
MTPIALHFEPEFDEYLHGMRLYDSKEIASPRSMIRPALIGTAVGLLLYWLNDRQWPYLFVGIALVAIMRLAVFSARKPQCRAIYKSKTAQGPFDVVFDENGMFSESKNGKTELAWHAFEQLMESPRVILLVYSKYGYVTVPKRAFASQEQLAEFRELATSKIGQDNDRSNS